MSKFLQLHLLTSYPPSNLNRDDMGSPKSAIVGGTNRIRISSQALKRAWRTSEVFETTAQLKNGTRTKELGSKIVYPKLIEMGVTEKLALESAIAIASVFGKNKKADKKKPLNEADLEQIVFISPEEMDAVHSLLEKIATSGEKPTDNDLKLLKKEHSAADLALFGRMLASSTVHNVEAAAQVSHAITVHAMSSEDDYFTAVDDLNTGEVDAGSSHIGQREFAAGLYYLYVCVNIDLLKKNLSGASNPDEAAINTLKGLVVASATVSPSGMSKSFASNARASYILAEIGDQQPRSLSVAFLKAIKGGDVFEESVKALESTRDNFDEIYDKCSDKNYTINISNTNGTMAGLLNFVSEA